jgi:hypothetical protein
MAYLSGWRIELPFTNKAGQILAELPEIEGYIHSSLSSSRLDNECNGIEWFDLTASEAIDSVSDILCRCPDVRDGHIGKVVTNDQFRNPHPRDLLTLGNKIIAWIYREQFTDRVKTQIIDDWKAPREKRRRYSRNGFSAIAGFTYQGRPNPEGNKSVHAAWTRAMEILGPSADDLAHGWVNDSVSVEAVAEIYASSGLESVDIDRLAPPEGVRPAYNRSA